MSNSKLPELRSIHLQQIIGTLTQPRLSKYLNATSGNSHQALRLYVLNTKVSAAFLTDLHYVEVALRNRFDAQLSAGFNATWFSDPTFLPLIDVHGRNILKKAQKDAAKHWPKGLPVPPGKVIAELSFGFWHNLTDAGLEHTLWVPYLHKAFRPRKAPKRALFNQKLEKLRQLRNRIAHHEPIFHLDLLVIHTILRDVAHMLCDTTASLMIKTSSVRREVMAIRTYSKRKGI